MTLVEKAKHLDAKIRAAGGLYAYWEGEQRRKHAAGQPFATDLIDGRTGEVLHRWNPDR